MKWHQVGWASSLPHLLSLSRLWSPGTFLALTKVQVAHLCPIGALSLQGCLGVGGWGGIVAWWAQSRGDQISQELNCLCQLLPPWL